MADDSLALVGREIDRLARNLRWSHEAREAEAKRARRKPDGRFRKADEPRNLYIAKMATLRQSVPGEEAEFWITPTPLREEWLRMREEYQQRLEWLRACQQEEHWPDLRQQEAVVEHLMKTCNPDALNGYVAFPKRHAPRLADGTGNLVQYIPVHGGVTYACKDSYAAVWGFDTQHLNSEHEPVHEPDWIIANCWILYRGLKLGAQLWPEFRRAGKMRRAELAQHLLDLVEEQPLTEKMGFEALLNTLTGRVG